MTLNSVLAGIIVARWLGAEGVGQLGVINVSVATVVQLASVGLPSANTYFISKDKKDFLAVASNSLVFALVVGSALAWGLTLLAKYRPDLFGFISPDLIRIAAISIPFQLITLIGLNIFLAVGNVRRFNLLDLVGQSFVLINAIMALVILSNDLWMLVSLNTVATVATGVLIVVLIGIYGTRLKGTLALPSGRAFGFTERRPPLRSAYSPEQTGRYETWRLDLGLLGRMLRYGVKFHVSILAGALIFRVDLLVVNHFRGPAEAGVYSVASQVAMMLMLLPGVIATLLFPRVAAEHDPQGHLTARASRHAAFIMFFICLASAPLSFLLPALYGKAFSEATIQLLILLPGVYLVGIESVLAQHFNAMGLPRAIPIFWVVTLIVNLALVVALVPPLGARGAAVASTASYTLIFALVFYYFRRQTGAGLGDVLLLRGAELRQLPPFSLRSV